MADQTTNTTRNLNFPSKQREAKDRKGPKSRDEWNLPPLRQEPLVSAIVCGDIHLSHKPPIARSAEENWYDAMGRVLQQIVNLRKKHRCLIICAGDIFDKWNAPAELINFAIAYLEQWIAVPGNHDLPHHNYKDLQKTAFWTLAMSDRIIPLEPDSPFVINDLRLCGFPCGFDVKPSQTSDGLLLEVAIVHQYIWKKGCSYPNAPEECRVKNINKKLKGYDCAIFSDNHISFEWNKIYNCGSLMRRKIDEINHKPSVGLLMSDGTIKRHYLDCSEDKFVDRIEEFKDIDSIGMNTLMEELSALSDSAINYSDAIHGLLDKQKVSPSVRKIILSAMEK